MSVLSVMPYFVAFLAILSAFWFKTTRLFCLAALMISQFIVVKGFKGMVKQARPEGKKTIKIEDLKLGTLI